MSIMFNCVAAVVLLVLMAEFIEPAQFRGAGPRYARISNGLPAQPGQFPYQVDLHRCSGVLISADWVLTDAICVEGSTSYNLTLGMAHRGAVNDGSITMTSTNIVIHPDFDLPSYGAEIAVLQLPFPVVFTDTIQPAMLPTLSDNNDDYIGRNATLSGWGLMKDDGLFDPVDHLQYVHLKVTSNDVCSGTYPYMKKEDKVCCDRNGPSSPCNLDDGGPLVVDDGNGPEVIGLFMYAAPSGDCEVGNNIATTYVSIRYYLHWIQQTTGVEIKP